MCYVDDDDEKPSPRKGRRFSEALQSIVGKPSSNNKGSANK